MWIHESHGPFKFISTARKFLSENEMTQGEENTQGEEKMGD